MDLISVIIPVYKVEKYLDCCVKSVISQTYENLEIILVDDGSPDRCPQICDEWQNKDSRIKVIHKSNGGLSDARNKGLASAKGSYIAFVDSDDWIRQDYIELLYNAIQETDSDLSACYISEKTEYEEECLIDDQNYKILVYPVKEALRDLINGEGVKAVAWNKLYKKEILLNELFEIGKLHEDEFFTYRILDKCKKIVLVEKSLYYYRQRAGSIMKTISIKHLDLLDAYLRRIKFLSIRYRDLYHKDKITFCIACFNFYCDAIKGSFGAQEQEAKDMIKKYRKQIKFSFQDWLKESTKNKIYIVGTNGIFIDVFANIKLRLRYF